MVKKKKPSARETIGPRGGTTTRRKVLSGERGEREEFDVRFTVTVPEELAERVRVWCATHNRTLSSACADGLRRIIGEE